MKKRLLASLLLAVALTMPIHATGLEAFADKEKREDGTFDVTIEEVIETTGLESIEWSDTWIPVVGMIYEENTLVSLCVSDTDEVVYIYVAPHIDALDNKQLQDLFVGVIGKTEREASSTPDGVEIGTEDNYGMAYAYVSGGQMNINYSMNTGSAIVDFIYENPVGSDAEHQQEFLEMMSTIKFKEPEDTDGV